MRRLVAAFGLLMASAAWAQEFEVNSSTDIGLGSAPNDIFTFSQRLDGSYSVPFGPGSGFVLKAHASAAFPAAWSADIDELSAAFVYKPESGDVKSLNWAVGRLPLTDPTGLILNHPGDGFSLQFDLGSAGLNVLAGYTGFTLRNSSGISLTLADQAGTEELFASPRFIASVEGKLNVGDHALSLSALAQQDLHKRSDLTQEWESNATPDNGGAFDSQYISFVADGPLANGVFYQAFATFGTGSTLSWIRDGSSTSGYQYEYKPVVSFLTGAEVNYFLPSVLSSSYTARILVASGDADSASAVEGNTEGWSTQFTPITSTSLGTVFNPALSNLVLYELGASAKPLPNLPLVTSAKLFGFQRAVAAPVNAAGVVRTGPIWMGEEVDLNVMWKPLSDLSVLASVGAFIPTAGTLVPGSPGADFQYAARVGVTLSL